jgi:adenine-specific DNA-methyltransferase
MANLSQEKRLKMLEFLSFLKDEHKDNDEALKAIHEIENEIVSKKYGLVWEEHEENVDIQMRTHVPVFLEAKDREIIGDEDNPNFNFLLEGDNLHSLKLLEKTHKGKIDVIYIDPPYNTGNKDFIYDDNYIGLDDTFRHSKWLSFMEKRLRIAKRLLTNEGVIFISIGDDEVSQLKGLMDEVYGEENYINLIAVKTKNAAGASGGGEDKKLKKNIEFLLVYVKNVNYLEPFETVYKTTEIEELLNYYKTNNISWKYTSVLYNRGDKEYVGSTVDGAGDEIKIYKRNNPEFKSVNQISKLENISIKEVYKKYFYDIHMTAMPQSSIRTRVVDFIGLENLNKDSLYSIEYTPKTGRNKGKIYEQFYKGKKLRLIAWFSDVGISNDEGVFKKDIEGTFWDGIELNNLTKEGGVKFENGKKPLSLIKRIISMYPYKDISILDFFAGSGTTGHAVVDLNKEDGGNRKYILCTNNENNICEDVTYQRLINIQEELPHNLKYYKTDFIPKIQDDADNVLSDDLLNHIKEMVQLEHGIDIDNQKYHIILTDDDADRMEKEWDKYKECKVLYISKNVLLTTSQNLLFSSVEINTIPDYYFESELREVGEIW